METMTLHEEFKSLGTDTLKVILNKLKTEEKNLGAGKRRDFFSSEHLTINNVFFVELLNKNFYKKRDEMNAKSAKFRNDDKNIEKYQLNHKKEKMRREAEYMELARPSMNDDLWEVELEQKLVLKALKDVG